LRVRFVVGLATLVLAASAGGTDANAEAVCDATVARATLTRHVQAFNRALYGTLQELFAQEPEFGWYSVAPPFGRTNQRAQNRATLMAYFRARHAKREVLHVVKFNFASTQERDAVVVANFNGHLTRRATDLPRERRGFKATIRCAPSPQFIVLSIGTKF
jgi:hypothetical protein